MRKNNKIAFTLAEVMIVLLVLTILFAAFAPIITKRQKANSKSPVDLWQWSTRDYFNGPMDAIYTTKMLGNATDKGSLFFGITPSTQSDIDDIYMPYSKLIIRSGNVTSNNHVQRQLQLRYGRNNASDPGMFAGTFLLDTKNILAGGEYSALTSPENNLYPRGNVGFGYNALSSITNIINRSAKDNTAVGSNALARVTTGLKNTAVGAYSGFSIESNYGNTAIGDHAGYTTSGNENTLIGYYANSGSGSFNTYIGAFSGPQGGYASNDAGIGNVGIGYKALSKVSGGNYNTAIGANALENLTSGSNNTAIGYNACSGLVLQSNKTCIGANSGPIAGNTFDSDSGIKIDDRAIRTYIGSAPREPFGGNAVLEIHNLATSNSDLINNPTVNSNTTTIINGNLIVKGKIFFTIGNDLYPISLVNDSSGNNYFGATPNNSCSHNQQSYKFDTTKCSELSPFTTASSDRRLKNILSLNNDGLDKITQLQVYNYIFKDDESKQPQVGVIAQELQKVFPNSVSTDEKGYLKIRWDEMFYASINAIKELNIKITALIKETVNIEKQITKMEKENSELQKEVDKLSARVEHLKNCNK